MFARTSNEMEPLQFVSQIILNLTRVSLINLNTFMLFVQRSVSKLPLGFFLTYFPSSIMAFYFRLFVICISESNK